MYDQSFSIHSLERLLRRADYRDCPALANHSQRLAILTAASVTARSGFGARNPLTSFRSGTKAVYSTTLFADTLIVRKLTENIVSVAGIRYSDRRHIVSNLRHYLMEGTPYRVFRLDIANFFESFDSGRVRDALLALPRLSASSKRLLRDVFGSFLGVGGTGIPRGLALSSALSELMMRDFDVGVQAQSGVHFYARYVDDIVVITDNGIPQKEFLARVSTFLPLGLHFHSGKKQICDASPYARPLLNVSVKQFEFDYLGYSFTVSQPARAASERPSDQFREVRIDIGASKVAKLKTRIVRAFLAFSGDHDFELLRMRIKFLTSNFRMKDFRRNVRKLSGIHENYPLVGSRSSLKLKELDDFLRNAVSSTNGRLFPTTSGMLSQSRRAALLRFSFVTGHANRCFYHFRIAHLRRILECWRHD